MADDSSVSRHIAPEPDPSGSLVPLPLESPTVPTPRSGPELMRTIRQLVDTVLDVADDVADGIASATGLGPRRDARP
jgi:hypothetical protein